MELTKTNAFLSLSKEYKQTEVGLIPEDWDIKELSSILKFGSGQDYKHLQKGDIPVYGTGGIMTYVDRFLYNGDSVGIGRKGTIDKPFFLTGGFWTVDTLFYTTDFIDVLPKFIYFKFLTIPWKEFNEASGVPSLNKNTIGKIKIPLPPTLHEQKAIATALSDVDSLISSLDKLITKKKAIKQGAMQALLKGKKRLKGFNDHSEMKDSEFGPIPTDWEVKLLPEVFDYIHGKAHEQFISSDGNYKVVNSKFVSTEGKVVKNSSVNFCPAKKGDILTVLSDLPNGKALAKTFLVEENDVFAVNQRVCIWRTKKDSSLFLNYVMNRNKYFLKLDDGVTQTHILNNHIEKCPVLLPKSIEEQRAIGECLKAMDLEIESLENKKAKYQEIKQGMMQELLTGKTRLI